MRLSRIPLAVLLVSAFAGGFSGCSCGTSRLTGPPLPPLSKVTLTPPTDTMVVGEMHQFVAAAFDTNGVQVANAAFAWSSGDPGVITVNSAGFVTANGEGVTRLIAAAGGKADTSIVAVVFQPGWYVQASGTTTNLNGVFFQPDGRNGWAVGDGGVIVGTNNAGATWNREASSTAFNLSDVWFTTDVTGFAVGNGGTVMRTRDAGQSWTRINTVGAVENLFGVCFADTAHGWAVGANGAIVRTANGGASWSKLNPTANQLNSVSFSDTTNGWAVGEGGVIVGTHDGGRSWYVVQPAVTALGLHAVWRQSDTLAVAGGIAGANPFTTATPDSLQWNLGSFGAANQVEGVQLVDAFTGYAVGTNGTGLVLKTLNGGLTWVPQVSNTSETLRAVWFVDGLRGWAVGATGRILHTSKGGN